MDTTAKKYCVALNRIDFFGIKKSNIYEYSCDCNEYDTYYIVYTRKEYNWIGHEDMFNECFVRCKPIV